MATTRCQYHWGLGYLPIPWDTYPWYTDPAGIPALGIPTPLVYLSPNTYSLGYLPPTPPIPTPRNTYPRELTDRLWKHYLPAGSKNKPYLPQVSKSENKKWQKSGLSPPFESTFWKIHPNLSLKQNIFTLSLRTMILPVKTYVPPEWHFLSNNK